MALILKGGALFLHVPKTGGNWVTKVLEECKLIEGTLGPKHADVTHLYSLWSGGMAGSHGYVYHAVQLFNYFLKKKSGMLGRNKPYIFSFVRHPFSWLESWFKYMSQPAQNWLNWGSEYDMHKWHPNSILNEVGDPDFNQFIRNVIMKRPGYVTELFGWYTTPEVDFVGKQENIRTDLIHVLKELNLDFDENIILRYPMVGVSKKLTEKLVWNEKLKQEIYELEYAGIVRYGYNNH